MKTKLFFCLVLVLGGVFAIRNSEAAIVYPHSNLLNRFA